VLVAGFIIITIVALSPSSFSKKKRQQADEKAERNFLSFS